MAAVFDEAYVEAVLRCVEAVPRGRVTTYGAIGDVVGSGPRLVGRALAASGDGVPWWRVVRADGSLPPSHGPRAREAYAAEGTPVRPSGRVAVADAFWQPTPPRPPVVSAVDDEVGP
ncbi:MGMT family protein [Nocardioidaceae bacterium]|nr:MGMT family protein [Nocardioidaceae bacterium]